MSKRVLLAEQNDAIRGVAETVLRQNGFDIIAVNSSDKLFQVLELSAPDLLLIDAGMIAGDGQPTHQLVRTHPKASKVPLALLADEYNESLGLPAAAVVLRPFDPANLLGQINQVMGSQPAATANPDPLAGQNLDDEFLDSALGLDNIQVTASEDMNKTGALPAGRAREKTKIVGIGQFENTASDATDTSKIQSLTVGEESDITPAQTPNPAAKANPNETSGLQLAADQYGLHDPLAFQAGTESDNHDYNWFVSSMSKDGEAAQAGAGSPPATSPGDENLNFTDSAALLDPVTPGPSSPTGQPSAGMDKFIDEFRQEVENLGDDGPDSIMIPQEASVSPQINPTDDSKIAVQAVPASDQASWEDKIENITPEHLRIFTRELASRLADKIAGLILARIDQDKLLRLIKDELIKEVRKKA